MQFLIGTVILFCLPCLPVETLEPGLYFVDNVVDADDVLGGFFQTVNGIGSFGLVGGDTRCFLEKQTSFFRSEGQRGIYQPLSDDGVSATAQPRRT